MVKTKGSSPLRKTPETVKLLSGDPRPAVQTSGTNKDSLEIEEISEEDIGYDADVEVVRPDHYEDADANLSELDITTRSTSAADEDLWQSGIVESMKTLDCNSDANDSQDTQTFRQNRKRRSRDAFDVVQKHRLEAHLRREVEISEVVNDEDHGSSPKRLRRRSRRSKNYDHAGRKTLRAWANELEKHEDSTSAPRISPDDNAASDSLSFNTKGDDMEID